MTERRAIDVLAELEDTNRRLRERGQDRSTILVHDDGREIKRGDTVPDFRGAMHTVVDWFERPFPSTGRVVLRDEGGWEHPYYPGVINARIEEAPGACGTCGDTETRELHGPRDQVVSVCATCGSDEP